MNSGGYTYANLEKDGKKNWVAAPTMQVSVGQELELRNGVVMTIFSSKSLNRTFDSIIFLPDPSPANSLYKGRINVSPAQLSENSLCCKIAETSDSSQETKIMLNGKKIVVVLPAYNAAKTLDITHQEIPFNIVDEAILVDDASRDQTAEVALRLGIHTIIHSANKGYGGNLKTCYHAVQDHGADIMVMLHPDYQYTPKLLPAMAAMIAYGEFDAVLASRILGTGALKGGMPLYKYIANRFLTFVENLLLGQKLSEYHTGYRAFSRTVLETLPLDHNSDDFVFDNQMLAQIAWFNFRVGEVSCPTKYFSDASSISFRRSVTYGLGVLRTALQFRLCKMKLLDSTQIFGIKMKTN
jgi:hypothetical protein